MPESEPCRCHGEPQYWQRDPRYTAGGFWFCSVKKRAREIARYDDDPIRRNEKLLKNYARARARVRERMRQRLEGMRDGSQG